MAGIPDLTKNEPAKRPSQDNPAVGTDEAEAAHRRVEHDAMNAAKRAKERMQKDEAGNDEFSNIGPV